MVKDIYFNPEYGKLYESSEHGVLETFATVSKFGKIEHIFIKRIAAVLDGVTYYDLVTPYGYGGPIIVDCKDKKALVFQFQNEFSTYCRENNIVSEFIRFHPIFENALDFKDMYTVEYSRHTIGTNLQDFDDPVQNEFSKSLRRELRKAEQAGVTCKVIEHPVDLCKFRKLYEDTMSRNNAEEYYFFPTSYYQDIIKNLGNNMLELQLIYQNDVIASELYFVQGNLMHAHLLGSNQQMLNLKAGVMLEANAAWWGKNHGYRYIHHGGGRSSSPDDALYLYKKKYGKHTEFDFYIGKKIWNNDIYNQLTNNHRSALENENSQVGYFPAYRA